MSDTNQVNGFTTKEVLIQLTERVDAGFKALQTSIDDKNEKHEVRIRKLEVKQGILKGALAILTFLVVAAIPAAYFISQLLP